MATDAMNPVQLDYSNPEVFFVGVYRYRTHSDLLVGVGLLAFAAFWGYAAAVIVPRDKELGAVGVSVFGGAGALCALGGGILVYFWATRHEVTVRVDGSGVRYGSNIWPWHRVAGFGGVFVDRHGGVAPELRLHAFGLVKPLAVTPPLTAQEFGEVASRLRLYLSAHHPHVKVDPEPRVRSD